MTDSWLSEFNRIADEEKRRLEAEYETTKQLAPHWMTFVWPFDQTKKCPTHPDADAIVGYGIGFGGFSSYTVCDECGLLISRTRDPDDLK